MALDVLTYALAKKVAEETAKGAGAIKGDKGDPGRDGTPGAPGTDGAPGEKGDKGDAFTYDDFTPEQLEALKGPKGDAGEQGAKGDTGEQGVKGDDGFSPVVTVTDIPGGHKVTITDATGDHSFDVMDGEGGGGGGVESFVVASYDERTGSYTLANEKTWEDISGAVANNKDVKLVFTDYFEGQNIYETLSLVGYNTDEEENIVELIFSNERSLFTEDAETVTVGGKGFYVDMYPNILRKYTSNGGCKFVKEHLIPRTNIGSSSLTMKSDYSPDYHDYANVFTISESENGVNVGVTVYGEPEMDVELTSKEYVDGAVEGKADKPDTYTKKQTDQKIAEGIATVDSEHFHPVTVLPDVADAKENHEYILIEYEQDGETIKSKKFYLFYDGAYHEDRAAGVSLDGYATEQYVDDGLSSKADAATTYNKTETNALLDEKANLVTDTATTDYSATVQQGIHNLTFGLNDDNVNVTMASPSVYYKEKTLPTKDYVDTEVAKKQDTLVSGQNIKTVNGNDITGAGNIQIRSGVGDEYDLTAMPSYNEVLADIANHNLRYIGGNWQVRSINIDVTDVTLTAVYANQRRVYYFEVESEDAPMPEPWKVVDGYTNEASATVTSNPYNAAGVNFGNGGYFQYRLYDDRIEYRQKNDSTQTEYQKTYTIGNHFEVGVEKWYGTYRVDGVTYQVYSKLLDIGPLPSAAGITNYPHGITGIKQILQINGFTNDGFVMNAPRQTAADNISIYQAQKSGNIAVEVGKDRSSKTGFVMLIYAKNN